MLERFSPATNAWFADAFAAPTPAQVAGWEAIARGDHTLIHAPTGSGKTLAAFLWAVDRLFVEPKPEERQRCRVLYVSPMKALAYDVDRNLRAPMAGIAVSARKFGVDPPAVTTALRTGDTPAAERRSMLAHPPDILITTPESLYLMLTSQVGDILRTVRWVIVDEIHAVAGTKRGSHLALSLERLDAVAEVAPQRIGLSATQRPLEAIAAFLGGGTPTDDGWEPRPVTIVDAPREKVLDVRIVVPVEDMTRPGDTAVPDARGDAFPADGPVTAGGPVIVDPPRRSIWPAMYPRLLDLVMQHRSTIVFANSRGVTERIAAELNDLAGEELAKAHHGSVSREQRLDIEDRLKRGDLRAVVATSSLELGIDMAAVDLVILIESPTSVARGLQRVGRAGHQVGAPSTARVFPKHRGDLLESAVVVDRMYRGEIEATKVPRNPLDVLAQHVVAAVAVRTWRADELYDLVRHAGPFRDLTRVSFDAVLDMLSGRYPSDEFAELRPRIVWDRVDGTLTPRGNARMLAVSNPGTIPDRGLYRVVLPEGGRVGELDEEMVYESRPGDVFVLGSSSWKISEITHDRVVVVPAPGEAAARMPYWHGDALGRPLELGRAIGEFVRTIGAMDSATARRVLETDYRLDPWAAANLDGFLTEERESTGVLPTDRTLVAERFRDEIGDWRLVLLSPFGARVHAPWALAARRRFRERHGTEVDVIWSDDGIVFRFPDADQAPDPALLTIDPEEIEELVIEEVGESALFTARFREAAARTLLLPRRRPGGRTPLWLQRRKAADLLSVTKRFGSFPVVLETYREVLQDHFDLPSLREVLGDIRSRTVRVAEVDTTAPSPFASSLLFDFVASFMYEYDAPVAERRAAALTLDRALLRDLMGEPEFRELLDADAIDQVEQELQRTAEDRRARSADGVDDLLRHLGPLTSQGVAVRCAEPDAVAGWLEELVTARRIVPIRFGGEERWAVIDDVARLRDALGVSPPPGIPESLLAPVADPLGDVVGRFARTHGPFTATDAASDLGLPVAAVAEVLARLADAGRVLQGGFRPGGHGVEWVDADVLRRLRRRSLAVLRREVEPVEPAALGRFLPAWHGIGSTIGRPDRLDEILRQLQGVPIPASILETDVLPGRMDYDGRHLDALAAAGEVVWIGAGALGSGDGRVALYQRDRVPLLHWSRDDEAPAGPIHEAIRRYLAERGASFFRDVYDAAGGGDPSEVLDALWDLVWAGEVTNDTLAPLRAFLLGRTRRTGTGRPRLPSTTPPAGSGRWYLVADLTGTAPAAEATAAARAEQLLERHGIVTRDAVLAESLPGGFAGLYPVLAAMEDAGRVRRGYFIEGLGGAQFALPGAVDRIRAEDATTTVTLAAADPANPFGATLAWPDHPAGRPVRRVGAQVVLVAGELAAYLESGGRRLLTFAGSDPDAVAAAIGDLGRRRFRRLTVETIDGAPAPSTPVGSAMVRGGFAAGYKGLVYRTGALSRA